MKKDVDLILDARLCFTHYPIVPIAEKIITHANFLRVLSENGARTLIHCVWGVDRTPFLAMVYYAGKYGVPYRDAYELVKSKRPATVYHPDWIAVLPALKS
jgi:protein-tyrosine phosphatase